MMYSLTGKTILILSPQGWGKMFLSKHHYAIELAKRGNEVYFLNPPEEKVSGKKGFIAIKDPGIVPGLFLIDHTLKFPYRFKFHALPLFHFLMRFQVRRITSMIGKPIDIVWSFDLGHLYPFSLFPAGALKVFHPVDEPLNKAAIGSAQGAEILFSVTREILEKYRDLPIPRHFINHGVTDLFLSSFKGGDGSSPIDQKIKIGFSGNLLREDLDRDTFLEIIRQNDKIQFECWGSYQAGQSNIGGDSNPATAAFIGALQGSPNVILHGPVPVDQLAASMQAMDGFLICYDIKKDQSGGTNYHKVMEYLSTGKVIISNNITTYKDQPDLVQMAAERAHNRELPALFKKVIDSLDKYNAPVLQEKRKNFAKDNTYGRQLDRIEVLLNACDQ